MVLLGNRWGDEDDDVLPVRTETGPDSNGIRTIVEYKFNENGKKVKVTKQVKQVLKVTKISKCVLERKKWAKFGGALKDEDNVTYTSNEDILMEDPNADQVQPGEKKQEENIFAGVQNSSIVVCRHCGMVGDHWTLKCPYKDTPAEELKDLPASTSADKKESSSDDKPLTGLAAMAARNGGGGGKYVPPSMRDGGSGVDGGSNEQDERDISTLRVTNISTETREDDLKDLFRKFGPVSRIYLAKDRETFQSRGFAFVSFVYRRDAEKALAQLQGFGYDHLILKLEWAKPSSKPKSDDAGSMTTTFRSGYGKALPQNMGPASARK